MVSIQSQSWLTYAEDLPFELLQCRDEGKNIQGLQERIENILALPEDDPARESAAAQLLDETGALPIKPGYRYHEPSDLTGILNSRLERESVSLFQLDESSLYDKIYGGWQGRCAGCLLGKPVESWMRLRIVDFNKAASNYPMTGYMRSDLTEHLRQRFQISDLSPFSSDKNAWLNLVDCAPADDDTNYTVLNLLAVENLGRDFSSEQLAAMWLDRLPILQTFTAERIAYRNLAHKILPPQSAGFRNIYREWIGAQIRADLFGYINPGQVELAARMAYRDACISHVKNGIYGEMWAAAMVSASFLQSDPVAIIKTGLSQVPHTSRFYYCIHKILDYYSAGIDGEAVIDLIHQDWDEANFYHWAHVLPNAQVVAAALLYGEMDFTRIIGMAVSAGFDTDCNAATAGSIAGVVLGAAELPDAWTAPLNDRLISSIRGAESSSISDLARRTTQLAIKQHK